MSPPGQPLGGSAWRPDDDGAGGPSHVPTTAAPPAFAQSDVPTLPTAPAESPAGRLTVWAIDFGFVALMFVAVPFLLAIGIAAVMGAAPPLPAGMLALLIVTPLAVLLYAAVVLLGSTASVGRRVAGAAGSGRLMVVAIPVLLALVGSGAAGSYVGDTNADDVLGMSIGGDSTSDRAEPTLDATDDDPESAPSDSATTTPQPELVEATCTGDDIQFAIDGVAAVADGILLELVADNSCEHSLAIDEDYRITLGTELGPLFSEVPVQLATTEFPAGRQTKTSVTITEADIATSTDGIDGGYPAVRSTVESKVSGGQTQDFFLVWRCELEESDGSVASEAFTAESDMLGSASDCNDSSESANWPSTTYGPVIGCPGAPSGTPSRPEASTDEHGWIGILESIPVTDPGLVNRRFDAFDSTGLELKLLDSRKFGSLRDPYWVIYGGPFATKAEASTWCESAPDGLTGQCYPRALQ